MGVEAWFTVGLVLFLIGLLIFTRLSADIVFMGGVTLLLVSGILTPAEALAGLANEGLVTVGVLYVVVAGLRETGGIRWIVQRLFGRPTTVLSAQVKLMVPVIGMSAFLNNTPVVAMLIPAVNDWAKQYRLPVSKLMIPLSYAAIFGGTCTLIGTSTNLVVNGLLIAQTDLPGLGIFEIAPVGIVAALLGCLYIFAFSRLLLPDRRPVLSELNDPREYTVEMIVDDNSPLIAKTIEQAGLRQLPGMYLAEIDRDGQILAAVSPREPLKANDRLVFVGIVESVVDLQKIRGLTPATDQVFKLDVPRPQRVLVEAVVSNSCPLIGKSIREGRFRSMYNAVVIAVARHGERVRKKVGDIVLAPGDTLLLEARPSFVEQQRNSRDFFLVSPIENSNPLRHERAFIALAILFAMVFTVTVGWLSMLKAALLAAGLMILTRCCTGAVARRSVDWQLLVVIAASFALGRALEVTGAADTIAISLIGLAGGNPWLSLAVVYAVTTVFTEMITNNGAAVLIFPIALATANSLGVSFMPFAIVIMMAASASFATPIGYQTNLMVYGPGGYHFSDYLRIGIPLNLLAGIVTLAITPLIWAF